MTDSSLHYLIVGIIPVDSPDLTQVIDRATEKLIGRRVPVNERWYHREELFPYLASSEDGDKYLVMGMRLTAREYMLGFQSITWSCEDLIWDATVSADSDQDIEVATGEILETHGLTLDGLRPPLDDVLSGIWPESYANWYDARETKVEVLARTSDKTIRSVRLSPKAPLALSDAGLWHGVIEHDEDVVFSSTLIREGEATSYITHRREIPSDRPDAACVNIWLDDPLAGERFVAAEVLEASLRLMYRSSGEPDYPLLHIKSTNVFAPIEVTSVFSNDWVVFEFSLTIDSRDYYDWADAVLDFTARCHAECGPIEINTVDLHVDWKPVN
jgi:hypothetical protein